MTDYPIPVEDYTGNQALTIICEACHAEEVISADDLLNDALYACPVNCGRGYATHKYEIGDRCKGCNKMGWFADELDNCCSRPCQLQAEYAKELAARKGAAA